MVASPLRGHPRPLCTQRGPVGTEPSRGGRLHGGFGADAQRQQQMSLMLQVWHGKDGQEVLEGCPRPGLVSPQHPPSWWWDPLSITHLGGGTSDPFSSTHCGRGPPNTVFTQAVAEPRWMTALGWWRSCPSPMAAPTLCRFNSWFP